MITSENFIWFWKWVGEFTTSSPSGIHYYYYKVSTKIKLSRKIHTQQLTLVARSGVYPTMLNVSLQVLMEKIAGVCLVEKLRYIQLYAADFNVFQQVDSGKEAIDALTDNTCLPKE